MSILLIDFDRFGLIWMDADFLSALILIRFC